MQQLPEELRREILSRLPVRSLLRFRCVSKSWLSLIDNPDFHLVHLRNFKNNRDETHLLVVEEIIRDKPHPYFRYSCESDKPKHCAVRCSNTFEAIPETLTLPPMSMNGKIVDWKILASVDGLVLLEMLRVKNLNLINDLILWNPSIRKFHVIPPLPEREPILERSPFQEANIGLGYDPQVKDYKLVNLVRINPNTPTLVAVYTLGVGSWKTSQIQGKDFSDFHYECLQRQGAVYIRGSLYFIAVYLKRDAELVWFDLAREEFFYSVGIPDSIRKERWLGLFHSGCSSLALLDFRHEAYMWVFDIKSMCWSSPCSLKLLKSPNRILYLKKNRDILIWWARERDIGRPAGNGWMQYFLELVTSYNLDSNEEKTLLVKPDDSPSIFQAYGYMESLVLPK